MCRLAQAHVSMPCRGASAGEALPGGGGDAIVAGRPGDLSEATFAVLQRKTAQLADLKVHHSQSLTSHVWLLAINALTCTHVPQVTPQPGMCGFWLLILSHVHEVPPCCMPSKLLQQAVSSCSCACKSGAAASNMR